MEIDGREHSSLVSSNLPCASPRTAEVPLAIAEVGAVDFDRIYADHFHEVHRWVGYLTGSAADADDLSQRVFEVVLAGIDRFDGKNVSAWLYAIARRVAAAHRRRAWFRGWVARDVRPLEFLAAADGSEDALLARITVEALLARLSVKLRATMILHEVEGYTAEEIGVLEGASTATIHSRLRLARARFVALAAESRSREGTR